MARGRSSSSSSLAPGFRFHPTDEELVRYYLKRKITNKPFRFDAISVTDIYKSEPWDLPGKSTLKSRDLEWYFFSVLDRKYGNGSKTNRATEKGYWKTTGKDRAIKCNSRTIGMKKTLVYHLGRAPRGERSNWVMHEYRLVDEQLQKTGISQDAFVVCRVFQKSGTGLKNGEQYGAPFVEEEWEDDEEEVAMLFGGETEAVAEEVAVGDDAYAQAIDFDQILNPVAMASGDAPLPLNYHHGETSNYVEQLENFSEDDQKPLIGGGDISEDDQKPLIGGGENQYGSDLPDRQNLYQSRQYEVDEKTIKDENVADPGFVSANDVDGTYWLDEPYFNATDNPSFSEGLFLEANDLSIPVELESAENNSGYDMVDEYLNFFDTTDDFTFDLSEVFGSENAVSDQGHPSQKDTKEGVTVGIQTHNVNDASSSKELPDVYKTDPDYKYPFIKQASHMLGSFPAPPAFASEFPTKEAALRLSAAQASTSIHVTAGMMRIEKNMALASNGIEWSFAKNGNINIIVSFGLSHGDTNRIISSSKIASMVSRRWLYLMFFWVMLLTVGYKIGIYICAK